jgi:MFS family permease
MILRFSLYGFLKNLRLFEAFLVLALVQRGLDFFAIGGLIAVREVMINLCEVPSGALADGFGRKRCMVLSMAAYVVAYLVLGLAADWWILAAGMVAYGIGDAFRSGTHKALIYAWLRQQGRTDERTRVYGYTRSWSKLGSACSALLGGAVLVAGFDYRWVFLASALPAALNLVNLATYPSSLDPRPPADQRPGLGTALRQSGRHLASGLRAVLRRGRLRRLVGASMLMEGGHTVVKDYLQPLLQALAIALPLGAGVGLGLEWDADQRTGVVVGVVSALAFLAAAAASRRAHRVEARVGDSDRAAKLIALVNGLLGLGLGAALWIGWAWPAAVVFVALAVVINLWRPIHVGRFDRDGDEADAATVLSIEAQAKALSAAILAPALGAWIDHLAAGASALPQAPIPATALWPVALVAALPLLLALPTRWRSRTTGASRALV